MNHKVLVGVGAEMDFHFFGAKRKKMNDNRGQVNNSWEIENCETQKKKVEGETREKRISTPAMRTKATGHKMSLSLSLCFYFFCSLLPPSSVGGKLSAGVIICD